MGNYAKSPAKKKKRRHHKVEEEEESSSFSSSSFKSVSRHKKQGKGRKKKMERFSLVSDDNRDGAASSNPEMDSSTLSVDVPAGIEPEKSKKKKEVPTVAAREGQDTLVAHPYCDAEEAKEEKKKDSCIKCGSSYKVKYLAMGEL